MISDKNTTLYAHNDTNINNFTDLREFCDHVIDSLSAEEIYNLYSHNLKGDGSGKFRGLPPFRESRSGTSFTVFPNKNFHDAGGDFSGFPLDYIHSLTVGRYEKARGRDWLNALKELAKKANLEMPDNLSKKKGLSEKERKWINRKNVLTLAYEYFHNALLNPNNPNAVKALNYLHNDRGITDETIKDLKIGFYDSWSNFMNYMTSNGFTPQEIKDTGLYRGYYVSTDGVKESNKSCSWENFITVPWLDANGRPLSLYGRYYEKKPPNDKTPKTLALPGASTKKHPFLFHKCVENHHREVVAVEGLFDSIMLYQSGINNVCSAIAAQFSNEQIDCLVKYRIETVTYLGDPDGGGDNGTKSNIKRLIPKDIDVLIPERLPDGLDPDEYILEYGIKSFKNLLDNAQHGFTWLAHYIYGKYSDEKKETRCRKILKESAEIKNHFKGVKDINMLWGFYFDKNLRQLLDIDKENYYSNFHTVEEKIYEENKENLKDVNNWNQAEICLALAEKYRARLAFDSEIQDWRRYEAEYKGVWTIEYLENVKRVLESELLKLAYDFLDPKTGEPKNVTNGLVNSVEQLLRGHLSVRKWDNQDPDLLPLLNGVLNVKTKEFSAHNQGNRLTWTLPYEYDVTATCEPVIDWLLEMSKDTQVVQLTRAYLKAIVCGRTDIQRYIELVGPGGSGKSTLMRIAQALIGTNNTHTTTLDSLENGRFETASIKDKRLVLIADSERYGGSVAKLKALTGQDPLPYEVKFKQSRGGFNPTALVIVAANEPIQSNDYTSGLSRRRITIPFTNKIPNSKQKDLVTISNGQVSGEFIPYLPGILNWILAMSDEEMFYYLKDTSNAVPSLQKHKIENLLDCNPLADWANQFLLLDNLGNKAYVGIKTGNIETQLYANYIHYMENSGSKPIAIRRFSNLLHDLFTNQLNTPIRKIKDRTGSYFLGIRLRNRYDHDQPLLISGDDDPNDPPTPSCNTTQQSLNVVRHYKKLQKNSYCESETISPKCDGKKTANVTAKTLTGDIGEKLNKESFCQGYC